MKIWEVQKLIQNLPNDTEVMIQDSVGDTFHTITAFYLKDKKTLTILADDIIF